MSNSVSASRAQTIALILAGAMFMQNLDSAIINTSLPRMAQYFAVSTVDLSLGVTAYMLASAAISPLSGFMADRFGSRTMLVASLSIFTLASAACGAAPSLAWFVVARLAQGAGGALIMPVGLALVMRHAAKEDMMRFTALIVWPALLAPILGPVLGGFITQHIDWRWNFWLNLPLGLIAVAMVTAFVPQHREEQTPKLDVMGFVWCSTALTCLIAGFQRSSMQGGERSTAIVLIVVGAITGFLALRHLARHAQPLLSLQVLQYKSFNYAAWMPGLLFRSLFSTAPFLLPLLFQLGFGLSPTAAGGWVLVYFTGNLGIKPFTTPILRRWGFRNVMWINGVLVALTMLGCGFLLPATNHFMMIFVLLAAGATRSMQLTSLTTLTFADVPNDHKNAASTLLAMLAQTSSAIGVALGAFLLALLRKPTGIVDLGVLHGAFWVVAALAFATALGFRSMSPDIGAEVSMHRSARRKIATSAN
jgi:EmrB/QacA subfamily drug resistance transporter